MPNLHTASTTMSASIDTDALMLLRAGLHGDVILPDTFEYDTARAVWNGIADARPTLIVRCRTVSDVVASVSFAHEQELPVSVRSGGHSVAGHSTGNGIVIDLSPMKGIAIDPERRIARIEPGLTWGEVAAATQPYGLAISAGDTATVGVGGLTLGGGIGWMVRKHGLAIDNLRAVELVTADGALPACEHDRECRAVLGVARWGW